MTDVASLGVWPLLGTFACTRVGRLRLMSDGARHWRGMAP